MLEFVVPYNPDWPNIYYREATKIRKALGVNCLEIHHVGSISVPGLLAKPKIDILAGEKERQKAIKSLEAIGIDYRGEYNIPMHYGF